MEAVLEINNFMGVFLLCNASRKKTIETLVDREGVPDGMLAQILDNVPELLIRFMTRCPEENQGEALRMLKALMEKEALPVSFPMALLCMGITQQLIGATEDYAGVRHWEEVAIDSEEMNEIKDEWVFK